MVTAAHPFKGRQDFIGEVTAKLLAAADSFDGLFPAFCVGFAADDAAA